MIKPWHRALIFDCDGTLADSMPAHYEAWVATLRKYKLEHLLPHERFMSLGGVPARVIMAMLAKEAGRELNAEQMAIEKEQVYVELAVHVKPIEVVVSIARENRGKLPMAIATGSRRNAVTRTLLAIGAMEWFDVIVSAEDVKMHKPHPETFLRAAELMGVRPGECLVYEDGEPGLAAARAAGMEVIDVREMLT